MTNLEVHSVEHALMELDGLFVFISDSCLGSADEKQNSDLRLVGEDESLKSRMLHVMSHRRTQNPYKRRSNNSGMIELGSVPRQRKQVTRNHENTLKPCDRAILPRTRKTRCERQSELRCNFDFRAQHPRTTGSRCPAMWISVSVFNCFSSFQTFKIKLSALHDRSVRGKISAKSAVSEAFMEHGSRDR